MEHRQWPRELQLPPHPSTTRRYAETSIQDLPVAPRGCFLNGGHNLSRFRPASSVPMPLFPWLHMIALLVQIRSAPRQEHAGPCLMLAVGCACRWAVAGGIQSPPDSTNLGVWKDGKRRCNFRPKSFETALYLHAILPFDRCQIPAVHSVDVHLNVQH